MAAACEFIQYMERAMADMDIDVIGDKNDPAVKEFVLKLQGSGKYPSDQIDADSVVTMVYGVLNKRVFRL